MRWQQHRFYDVWEKASRLLAWLQHRDRDRDRERSWVPGITSRKGVLQTSSTGTADTFATYYEAVYASETKMTLEVCFNFLRDVSVRQFSGEGREALEVELTEEELVTALQGLQSGKAPGPNGLPIELFKVLADVVVQPMLAMLKESYDKGCTSEDLSTATIVVLHKEVKAQMECSSYRPISFLNAEVKVLARDLGQIGARGLTSAVYKVCSI
ncbi:hypothetical protein NDU88_002548 [Pleurodeles waltl]|uniref:Uncharacterized protein n=1 Tax=Pleurodeles waltl TaxID=8319 RepID=A0AAV7W2G6_PLEWA|nr:hypothetical protein NDU88_002548 [Pleurodeles waltl]